MRRECRPVCGSWSLGTLRAAQGRRFRARSLLLALAACATFGCGETPDAGGAVPDFLAASAPASPSESCRREPDEHVAFSMRVLDWRDQDPLPQVSVRACERSDPGCEAPSAQDVSSLVGEDTSGALSIDLPKGFDGVLELRSLAYVRTLLWLEHPLCQSERITLPVWLFASNRRIPASGGSSSNQLLLQRIACDGSMGLFPPAGRGAAVRVSPAGAATGQRVFSFIQGTPLDGTLTNDQAGERPQADPQRSYTSFLGLPVDEDLVVEVFDYVDNYEVLFLRIPGRSTNIASVSLRGCEAPVPRPR